MASARGASRRNFAVRTESARARARTASSGSTITSMSSVKSPADMSATLRSDLTPWQQFSSARSWRSRWLAPGPTAVARPAPWNSRRRRSRRPRPEATARSSRRSSSAGVCPLGTRRSGRTTAHHDPADAVAHLTHVEARMSAHLWRLTTGLEIHGPANRAAAAGAPWTGLASSPDRPASSSSPRHAGVCMRCSPATCPPCEPASAGTNPNAIRRFSRQPTASHNGARTSSA